MRLRAGIVLLATLFLASLGSWATPATAQQAAGYRKVLVDKRDQATIADLTRRGGTILVDYPSFALWRVPDAATPALQSVTGASVRDDFDRIGLRGGASIDTRAAAPPAPSNPSLRQTRSSDPQLWLVQFVGPIKEAWLDDLRAGGLDVVMYMPSNAYVVWGDGAAIARLEASARKNPVIQFTGPYHPAYRVAPTLQDVGSQQPSDAAVPVTVQFFTTSGTVQSIARLRALGGRVYLAPSTVLTMTNISLDLPAGQVATVAAWPDVFNVEPYVAPHKMDEAQGQIIAGSVTPSAGKIVPVSGTGNYLNWLSAHGFPTTPASYPVIDVVDDGLDNGTTSPLHPDFYTLGSKSNASRIVYNQNCTTDPSADGAGGHGNLNLGIVGAYNNLMGSPHQDARGFRLDLGISPYGRLASTRIFRGDGNFDTSGCGGTYEGIVQASFAAGATITSNSWGSSAGGAYDSQAQSYDALTRDASSVTPGNQQMLHIFSAGNDGSSGANTTGSPGSAKNVLTVGATENVRDEGVLDGCGQGPADNADDVADFSSRGPTADQRIKPDIMAPGIHITAAASQDPAFNGNGVCGSPGNHNTPPVAGAQYYPAGQTLYTWSTGTSHSAPAVAGAASLVYNYYGRVLKPGQTPSPAMIKALLLNTPRYLTGSLANDTLPSAQQGWGDVNLGALFDDTTHRYLVDQSLLITASGQEFVFQGNVAQSSKPLRVTLVWTDPPGSTTGNAYVNDISLSVRVGNTTYSGNNFSGATSVTGGSGDGRNNVESVFLPAGTTGTVKVTVYGVTVAGDGVPGNASALDQDFALVISNADVTPTPSLVSGSVTTSDASGNTNGFVDPGETIGVQVGATNVGAGAATGLTSTLSTVSGNATVVAGTSAYADIAAGATGTNTTPYQVQVAQGQACGTVVTVRQDLKQGATTLLTRDIPLTVGKPTLGATTPYTSTDVPKAIPDNNPTGVLSNLTIPAGAGTVGKLTVTASITHTFDSDLVIQVIAPSGKVVTLANRRGFLGHDFTNVVFDDAASQRIDEGNAPFTGSFRPETPLAALIGEPIAGTWKLKVVDAGPDDTGSITAFKLNITAGTFNCQAFIPAPDLTLTKAHVGSFTVGQNGIYTLTVNNVASGPTALATSGTITVTDTLPAGLTYVSGSGTGWTCGAAAQTVTCTSAGPIAPGTSSGPITLTVSVGAAAAPSTTNSASVATTGETNTANNGATDLTNVDPAPVSTASLNVQKAGSGSGTITSSDSQIACGSTCGATYTKGTVVTLTATPATGSTFAGWSGACTGTGTCQVTLNAGTGVTATFERVNPAIQVGRQPGGPALTASIAARAGCGTLISMQFGEPGRAFDNARVTVTAPAGGPAGQTSGFAYTPPAGTTQVSLTVERVVAQGGATVAPIRFVDGCGEWQTFVGGGPDAFR